MGILIEFFFLIIFFALIIGGLVLSSCVSAVFCPIGIVSASFLMSHRIFKNL